tara:strand:- start:6587 stop:7579 length:993 start_codon:yes stop_codon:yes gene_type:complete
MNNSEIFIFVNGNKQLSKAKNLDALLNSLNINKDNIAIEINKNIISKNKYKKYLLKNNDKIEIVNFIGGGSESIKNNDDLKLAGKKFKSRLIIGSGKFKNFEENLLALKSSNAEIITVAVRRVNILKPDSPRITDIIDPKIYTYLPNTAGCYNAEEAFRTLQLAREAGGWDLVKLEVIGNEKNLYPNMIETLKAAELLVKDNFKVMAYCSDDPILAKQLEDTGCTAIMPIGSPIGSGRGIQNKLNIKMIIQQSTVPVIVDAGIGTASDASLAMELGCAAVLVNSAIALAKNPVLMGNSMKHAVIAGRKSFLSVRMDINDFAIASSPKKDF